MPRSLLVFLPWFYAVLLVLAQGTARGQSPDSLPVTQFDPPTSRLWINTYEIGRAHV
jgi:hypothetical protein